MKQVNHIEMEKLIEICYNKKIPLFVWGSVGIGKSDTVRLSAKNLAKKSGIEFSEDDIENGKFGFVDIRISQLDPSDLRGLPSFDKGKTKWMPPSWLPTNPTGKGILFFDELNLSAPSVQAACFQLILDRRLGDYKLPNGWFIVAAGNRVEDNPRVFDMPSPLLNRFVHCELKIPSSEEWTDWALKNQVDTRIISFLNFKPSLLFKYDAKMKDKSFPTPRSWVFVSTLVSGETDEEIIYTLVSCGVGEGCAVEFGAFNKLQRKIDLDAILKNPESTTKIKDIDLKYSLVSFIAEKYRSDRKLLGKILNVCDYLDPEFAILMLRFTKSANPKWLDDILKEKKWEDISKKYGKYLV
jgi:hypothetical protein